MANNYPFVLIHGYNNMTDTFGPAREILTEAGYECYSPHIGPFTPVRQDLRGHVQELGRTR